ncbi:MAG: hypothetical protein HFE96_06670 [Acutalibacter sp.]|nr:hypothetical protein [Acutalibacter sp.]
MKKLILFLPSLCLGKDTKIIPCPAGFVQGFFFKNRKRGAVFKTLFQLSLAFLVN